jgi:hypothetical protein
MTSGIADSLSAMSERYRICSCKKRVRLHLGCCNQLLLSDGMKRGRSDGMLYAPKLSTRFEAQEIIETDLLPRKQLREAVG